MSWVCTTRHAWGHPLPVIPSPPALSASVLCSGEDSLLSEKPELLNTTRDRKHLLQVMERIPVTDDLLGVPMLNRDGDDCNIGLCKKFGVHVTEEHKRGR